MTLKRDSKKKNNANGKLKPKKSTKKKNNVPSFEEAIDPKKKLPIIIVHGSSGTKVGLAGEKFPRFVLPEKSIDPKQTFKRFPLIGSKPTSLEKVQECWNWIIKKLKA